MGGQKNLSQLHPLRALKRIYAMEKPSRQQSLRIRRKSLVDMLKEGIDAGIDLSIAPVARPAPLASQYCAAQAFVRDPQASVWLDCSGRGLHLLTPLDSRPDSANAPTGRAARSLASNPALSRLPLFV